MRVIIACAGEQSRWANHLGVPKHLAPTGDGEPLLHRTVRLARTLLGSDDVHVTLRRPDARYEVPGATLHVVGAEPSEYEASRSLWSTETRTVLMLGDVYFTEHCVRTIAERNSAGYWCFGRKSGSTQTFKRYGEIFAVSWWPAHHGILDRHLANIRELIASGKSRRPPGWLLLRLMQHTPLDKHIVSRPWFVEVDDLTDDIDIPADHDRHPELGGGVRARV